jgi:RNA methyltransferase, TrmH family
MIQTANRQSAMKITSRDNSLLRRARSVRDGNVDDLIFIEGLRLCEEALLSDLKIEALIYSDQIARKDRAAKLIAEIETSADKTAVVSENLLESISYTKTPQGIILLASRPVISQEKFQEKQSSTPLIVILHGINNPVNVGAILRTAEAAGVTGAMVTPNTADPFSPKSLRGAMGSAFRLPIRAGSSYPDVISWCRKQKIRTVCAVVNGQKPFTEFDWRKPCALILGPESTGLSDDEIAAANQSVFIPMAGQVESLNVAVATGILLYEAFMQRRPPA